MNFGKSTKSGLAASAQKAELSPQARARVRKARQTRQERINKTQGPAGPTKGRVSAVVGDNASAAND